MEAVVRWCLKNKSVVLLAAVILIASGVYATTRLNQELLPEIEFPIVIVSTPVPGAGPDLVEEQVTQPVEAAVDDVEGIESIQSTSSAGFSVILIEFSLDTDTKEAEAELNSALDGITLPQQAEEPEVQTQSASEFPIMNVSLSAEEGELSNLTNYARDEAVPLIEDVEGVASADLVGGVERRIEVEPDPRRLEENDLSADAVVGAISGAAGVNTPVGEVEIDGLSTPVRTTSGLADAGALAELPVGVSGGTGAPTGAVPGGAQLASMPDGVAASAPPTGMASAPPVGAPVMLGDVAEVREVSSDISGVSRTNGEPSLGINITKEPDANTVEVADGVNEALADVRDDLGEDRVLVLFNSAEDVEESVSGLVDKALIGGVLAILIIFLFLGSLRATLVTAVSLPTSILAALLFSWADNLTLNIITLAGLTIAVGRVVDDAIVVLENSYRYVQGGYEPEEAALKGTTEVASAITSSTLTTTAVFLPLALVGGIVSKFFVPLSLTVALALVASLIVAVTIIPVLVSIFLRRHTGDPAPQRTNEDQNEDSEHESTRRAGLLLRLYTPMLRWSLRHRLAVLLLALLTFAGGLGLVRFLPVTFFPPSEERLLVADVELPAGTALGKTSEKLRPFEDFLKQEAGIKSYQVSIGGEDTQDPESPVRPGNKAQAFINVRESADVKRTLDRVDREGDELYGENFQVQILSNGPPQGGLEAVLTGGSKAELAQAADLVSDEFRKLDAVNNVESDLSGGNPEVKIRVNPEKAAKAGLSPTVVSGSLGSLLGDSTVTTLGDTPVVVGVPEGSVDSLDEVQGLPVGSDTTVGEVAEVGEVESPVAVSRTDGERAVTVTGGITSTDTQTVSTEAQRAIADLDLPANVTAQVGGENENIDESFRNLFLSIIVALVLVFLLLVVFFGSLLVPLVILLAVPLTTVGAFGAMYLTNTAISVPSLLGILLLIGIVVSNAILLVDFAVKAQDRYGTSDEAILAAARARLRPILMTAFATIFALMPLALGLSGGGNGLISSSLAITVVGGLATSTFLTLLVVPVGYSLLKSSRRRKEKAKQG